MPPLYTVRRPSVAAFYATGQRRAVDENIQQSTICRNSEVVSHARKRSSILPAGNGKSDKMTLASDGFITCSDWLDHPLSTHWHSQTLRRLRRLALRHHRRMWKRPYSIPKAETDRHPHQVLPVSFALRWSRRQQRMDYLSIFCSSHMARKSVQCAGGQLQGRSRYCAVHATNCRLAGAW